MITIDPLTLLTLAGSAIGLSQASKSNNEGQMKQIDTLTPAQKEALDTLLSGLTENMFKPTEQYTGGYVAPETEAQQQATSYLSNLIESSTLEDLTKPTINEEYYETNVYEPLKKAAEEERTRLENEYAGKPGTYWSSARENAIGDVSSNFISTLARERANLANQAQNRALQGTQTANSLAQTLGSFGATQQNLETQGLLNAYNEFVRTRPENSPMLNYVLQAVGLPTSATYYQPPQQSALPALIGAFAQIASGAAQSGTNISNIF